jgi:glucose/arabinose dehydrogenase
VSRKPIALVIGLAVASAALITFVLSLEVSPGKLSLETVYGDLAFPVSFVIAPDGRWFYNELREGNVRVIQDGVLLDSPFLSLNVVQLAETGLLGLALHPEFPKEPYVYIYYTYDGGDGIYNRISRFPDMGNVAGPEEVILDRIPANSNHNGGRLVFGPDGMIYASVGDALRRKEAQDPNSLAGKILRMEPDGAIPEDNPFPGSYAYLIGIRNVFGLAFTPGGVLLFTENGPRGNDEVNFGRLGGNYGWPVVQGKAGSPQYEDPLLVFTPSIAPTGITFYSGSALGRSYGDAVYFASWEDGALRRLLGDVESGAGSFEAEVVLQTGGGGILDVVNGPDGHLYVSLPDRISRVVPATQEQVSPEPWSASTTSAVQPDPLLSMQGSRGESPGFRWKREASHAAGQPFHKS